MILEDVDQIIPAAAGWRIVSARTGYKGQLTLATDADLFTIRPVAAFALGGARAERQIVAIAPDDWPSYLYPIESMEIIDYLGPGEEIGPEHRDEAKRQIKKAQGR